MIGLEFYSPLEKIHDPLFEQKQVKVFIKRDDLIHPFISGNKWRKLKYILQKASQQQKKHLVTFGGAYSNHLLATACASAKFGFSCTGFVRGEAVENEVLSICRMFGMKLIFTGRKSYRDKQTLFRSHYGDNPDTYFIDEGGASEEAVKGCAELIAELKEPFDHIFCAAGTGTTAAGILQGIKDNQFSAHLHAVPVLKNGQFILDEIKKCTGNERGLTVHTDYHFGGYAKTTPQLINFVRHFASSTGILLDPVYTGKMVFAVLDLIEKNTFPAGNKILMIHTGGLFGLLGKLPDFRSA